MHFWWTMRPRSQHPKQQYRWGHAEEDGEGDEEEECEDRSSDFEPRDMALRRSIVVTSWRRFVE